MEVKKIIFDLDNTLIPWEERYNNALQRSLNLLGCEYSLGEINVMLCAVNDYEKYYKKYDMVSMKYLIDSRLNKKLPDNFMDMWLNELGKCVPLQDDKELFKLLYDLNKKYRLSVFTDWFKCSQVDRLRNAGLLNFFDDVIGCDQCAMKPYGEGFIQACKGYDPSECVMIGDDFTKDIIGASSVGMHTILFDQNDKYKSYQGYKVKKLGQIRDYL